MNDNVTIEKLDLVMERVSKATYAEAKDALVKCSGDVVEAIILLESSKENSKVSKAKKTMEDVFNKDSDDIKAITNQVKELIKKSSVIRIIVEKNNKVIINIPLTVGVVSLAVVPIITLVGLSTAVLTKYRIQVQNEDDGSVVDLGELNEEKMNMLKTMLTNTAKDVKDVVMDKNKDKDEKDVTDELIKEVDEEDNNQ